MDDAAKRISRYLLMQLVINVLYGIPVGIGLYFIGVPNPILWGLLATVLRFVPYVGPVIAALFPIALSFAVAPGWTLPLLTIALFVVSSCSATTCSSPGCTARAPGSRRSRCSLPRSFWTTLWGPVGLLLSTPLTVCLVVLGRHVPQLGFFDVLLGDEPALAPEVKFYQRLLARDPEEAAELAEEYLEEEPLEKLYDAVIVPALGFRRAGPAARQPRSGDRPGDRRGHDRRRRGSGGGGRRGDGRECTGRPRRRALRETSGPVHRRAQRSR